MPLTAGVCVEKDGIVLKILKLISMACLFAGAVTGCQAMVPHSAGPTGADSPFSAHKEDGAGDDTEVPGASSAPLPPPGAAEGSGPSPTGPSPSGASFSGKFPSGTQDLMASAGDNAQAGGVSALPADVEGGEGAKTAYHFTIEGVGNPVCRETSDRNLFYASFPKTKYRVAGRVGAVLMDGTVVPLYGCGQVAVRFQEGAGDSARCATARVKDDCEFSLNFTSRQIEDAQVYIFTHYLNPGLPIPPDYNPCGDMDNMREPAKNEITFAAAGRDYLPVCVTPAIDGSILAHPSFQSKIPK